MGAAPIVIFRGLPQSRAQGHGELGPPHFPGYIDLYLVPFKKETPLNNELAREWYPVHKSTG